MVVDLFPLLPFGSATTEGNFLLLMVHLSRRGTAPYNATKERTTGCTAAEENISEQADHPAFDHAEFHKNGQDEEQSK